MIASLVKKLASASVADVDDELDRIKAQMQAAAAEQASTQAAIDELLDALRVAVENDADTSEIEGQIVTARVGLERLALRHSMLERVAREKAAALKDKKFRIRVAHLEAAETAARAELATLDEEIIETAITLSEKLSRRLKVEHDAFGTGARVQHITGIPRGLGDLAWNEAPLVAEFLRRHAQEATRPVSLGELAWGPFTLTLPTLTPDRTVPALVADDEAASA